MDKISAFLSEYVDLNKDICIKFYFGPTHVSFSTVITPFKILSVLRYLSLSQFFVIYTNEYHISLFNDHIRISNTDLSLVTEFYF